jgi:hypothetical protein
MLTFTLVKGKIVAKITENEIVLHQKLAICTCREGYVGRHCIEDYKKIKPLYKFRDLKH